MCFVGSFRLFLGSFRLDIFCVIFEIIV